jgi:hypothetical protein
MRVLRQNFYCGEVRSAFLFISLQAKDLSRAEGHAGLGPVAFDGTRAR